MTSIECQGLNASTKHDSSLELFKSFCLYLFSCLELDLSLYLRENIVQYMINMDFYGGEPPLYHSIQKFELLNQNVAEEELSLTK